MIVLISPEKDIKDEHLILNALFEEGLKYYHLRKPGKSGDELKTYLGQISLEFLDRVMIHTFHGLASEFELKGVHLQEQFRRDLNNGLSDYVSSFHKVGYTVSSSFHEMKELANCDINFDYHLLSPVFSSISKQGYEGRGFDVNNIKKPVIGMGGVTAGNLDEFDRLGFSGVGVLGGIWNSKDPVSEFKLMNKQMKSTAAT